MGNISAHLPEVEAGNLVEIVATHPLSWFLVGGGGLEAIRYMDHKLSNVPTDKIRSNCKTGFVNFSLGYTLGYATSYVAKLLP